MIPQPSASNIGDMHYSYRLFHACNGQDGPEQAGAQFVEVYRGRSGSVRDREVVDALAAAAEVGAIHGRSTRPDAWRIRPIAAGDLVMIRWISPKDGEQEALLRLGAEGFGFVGARAELRPQGGEHQYTLRG